MRFIVKRDGHAVAFDPSRIETAVGKAMRSTGEGSERGATSLAVLVTRLLDERYGDLQR